MSIRSRSSKLTTGLVVLAAVLALLVLVPLGSCSAGGARRPTPAPAAPPAVASTGPAADIPSIQFDSKGVEFGPWLKAFVAQVRSNWMIPQRAMAEKGHVAVTCRIRKDGTIVDISVAGPSSVEVFNLSARNALATSNPTIPLPSEYPDESAFFTITFFFNESPPGK
jgi:TonB family protein